MKENVSFDCEHCHRRSIGELRLVRPRSNDSALQVTCEHPDCGKTSRWRVTQREAIWRNPKYPNYGRRQRSESYDKGG